MLLQPGPENGSPFGPVVAVSRRFRYAGVPRVHTLNVHFSVYIQQMLFMHDFTAILIMVCVHVTAVPQPEFADEACACVGFWLLAVADT